MAKATKIASHVRIALADLVSAKKLGFDDRNSAQLLFYAAENLLMATMTSEGIDLGEIRKKIGNHQLDRMIDQLPSDCIVKKKFEDVIELTAYATTFRYPTPSGKIPDAPEFQQVSDWFDILFDLAQLLTKHFQIDIRDTRSNARNVAPLR